jgi:hypothetical protein
MALGMRRIMLMVAVALVLAAMMVASAMPAFAQPGGSENSCGASNPEIGSPPSRFNKGEEEFENCGMRNNPQGGPPGLEKAF